ncbi:hypothetical protein B0E53_01326 [Micromonospora sp. MH33]|nr:hypothetical protein B0E53_01326 [Micromonospora sp. MH33]
MLTHHRTRLDRIDLTAWTDITTTAQTLYTRHGYTPLPAVTLPDGPTLQPMRRNAAHHGAIPTNAAHPAGHRWQNLNS